MVNIFGDYTIEDWAGYHLLIKHSNDPVYIGTISIQEIVRQTYNPNTIDRFNYIKLQPGYSFENYLNFLQSLKHSFNGIFGIEHNEKITSLDQVRLILTYSHD